MLLAAKKEEKRPLLVDRKETKEDATRRLQQILKRGGEGEQSGDEGGAGDQLLESIIHCNIKVENILLDETHSKAVIADFGLSNYWDANSILRTRCGSAEVNTFFFISTYPHPTLVCCSRDLRQAVCLHTGRRHVVSWGFPLCHVSDNEVSNQSNLSDN